MKLGSCSRFASAVLIAIFCRAAIADDADDPSVTPYRPTVSNPADLSAPGWLEGEFGGLRELNDDRSRDDTAPWLLKYAFDENHGVLLGGNAYIRSQVPGTSAQSGFGDTSIEYKQRFPISDTMAFGIETGVVLPTAAHDGVGSSQVVANGIFSADLGKFHLDLNLGEAHGGDQSPGASKWQTTWATAISTQLVGDLGAAFELSGTYQAGDATQSQALFAFNYNVSHRLTLDAGASYGLAHDAHNRGFFAGATVLIGRLH